MKKLTKSLKKCKNDVERWNLLVSNKDKDFKLVLDNDDTMVVIGDECLHLDCYVGNSEGVGALLDVIGIKNEMC